MTPTFSLLVNHTPWVPERVVALGEMLDELAPTRDTGAGLIRKRQGAIHRVFPFPPVVAVRVHETDYRAGDEDREGDHAYSRAERWQQKAKVDWALEQWRWSAREGMVGTGATHHVFMTDDLNLAPGFWGLLSAMVAAHPDEPIGLLSNHPKGPQLAAQGYSGYRTNSWLVGPAYVLPHDHLVRFLAWFEALPDGRWTEPGTKAYRNDDSSINEWITNGGGGERCWHPLPTIIEHRSDIGSTVGHGDQYSRERVSWRRGRRHDFVRPIDQLTSVDWWARECPMLALPEDGR